MLRVENQKPNESNATVPLTTKYSIRYGARAVEWERMQKYKINKKQWVPREPTLIKDSSPSLSLSLSLSL